MSRPRCEDCGGSGHSGNASEPRCCHCDGTGDEPGEDHTFNGHKDWQHWNVALWLANDEPLYRLCVSELREAGGRRHAAAKRILAALGGPGTQTPDEAEYTVPTIREALKGFAEDLT